MKRQKATLPNKEDEFWQTYFRDNKVKEPERLEDAAKFLSGMISISLTIFLKINDTAFDNLPKWVMIFTISFWLISLAGSFLVFFPFQYPVHENAVRSIKDFHTNMVRRKRLLLLGSTVCFFLALGILGVTYIARII